MAFICLQDQVDSPECGGQGPADMAPAYISSLIFSWPTFLYQPV